MSENIGMKFGIDKRAMLVLKKRNITKVNEGDSYKYLGVTEADLIKCKELKQKAPKENLDEQKKLWNQS